MRGDMHVGEYVLGVAAVLVLLWPLFAVLRWIDSLFRGSGERDNHVPDVTEIHAARVLLETPRPVAGGTEWVRYECRPVMCDPPPRAQQIEVHDPTAPGHDRKTCKFCNERPNYSGASYRPIN